MKRTHRTELGDYWHPPSTPSSVHERLGNGWWAWMNWVLTLEETAGYIAQRSFYVEQSGEVVMPLIFCVRAMLLGYAIECALKCLWVKKGNKIVTNGKYAGVAGAKDHDLMQLSKAVGFVPTMTERDVLQRLSKFVRFAGRYPIAKNPNEMRPHDIPAIGKVDVGFFSKRDFRTAQSALNKILSQISGKKRRVFFPPRRDSIEPY